MLKTILVFLVIAAACVAGNPAAGAKEWRWKARHPTVSPNIKFLPFKKVIDSYTPSVRIPGTKTVEGCGPVKPQGRIVGGSEAIPHSYPWQVALFIDDKWFCGGSIINEEWVLTAAHCAENSKVFEVVAGAHKIQESEDTQKSIISEEYVLHPDWNPYLVKGDLALIKLPEPLTWTDAIAPVCLPSRSDGHLATGTLVNPSGWGRSSDSAGGISDVLRQVTVPVGDFGKCNEEFGGKLNEDFVICTDSAGGKGTCNGDSGGPLNYVDGGVTYTRGIVSFGSSSGCMAGNPDGFTRVIGYLDWIETITGIAIDD